MKNYVSLVPALQWSLFLLCPELEAIAANAPPNKPFVMSPSEAKFIAYLIMRHGTNYKVGIEQVLNAACVRLCVLEILSKASWLWTKQ